MNYGGTITFARAYNDRGMDILLSRSAYIYIAGVVEKLGVADWEIARDQFDFQVLNSLDYTTGALAEDWEQPDATTYVVSVRRGVRWQDKPPVDGRELTAGDVLYNFHRILSIGDHNIDHLVYDINQVEFVSVAARGRYEVVFELEEPSVDAARMIFDGWSSWIYPPETIQGFGGVTDWKELVGTGPFVLSDWVEGSSITWSRNPDYWGADSEGRTLPYIDELKAIVIADEDSRIAALRAGQIDYVGPIGDTQLRSFNKLEGLLVENETLMPHVFNTHSDNAVAMNTKREPFGDIRVRMAMQMAIELEEVSDRLYGGWADTVPQGLFSRTLKDTVVPFAEWGDSSEGYRYDPGQARELLKDAGYPNGFSVELVSSYGFDKGYLELLAEYWGEIGIDASVSVVDGQLYSSRLGAGEFDLISAYAAHKWIPLDVADWIQSRLYTYAGIEDATLRHAGGANDGDDTIEGRNNIVRELGQMSIDNHWMLFGPIAPRFAVVQPWIKGFSGEASLGNGQYNTVFSRLWVDLDLKEAME